MFAVVAGAAAAAVVDVVAENGAVLPEVVDEADLGFPGNCSFLFSKSYRFLVAIWSSSRFHCPCLSFSCNSSAVAGREELAFESIPAD